MLPGGRERRVVHTRDYDFHYRSGRQLAVLRVVKRELEGIQFRCDYHSTVGLLESVEFRQFTQSEMQFRDVAIAAQAPDSIRKADIEMLDADQLKESPLWVRSRNDVTCLDLFAVGHAAHLSLPGHRRCRQSILV